MAGSPPTPYSCCRWNRTFKGMKLFKKIFLILPFFLFFFYSIPCIQCFLKTLIAYPIHTQRITLRMLLTLRVKSADCQQICKLASPSISLYCGALLLPRSDNDPLQSSKSVAELLDSSYNRTNISQGNHVKWFSRTKGVRFIFPTFRHVPDCRHLYLR